MRSLRPSNNHFFQRGSAARETRFMGASPLVRQRKAMPGRFLPAIWALPHEYTDFSERRDHQLHLCRGILSIKWRA
jgi:hypothetical protein